MTLDQFTTQASDYAVKVDHLFYLLSVISGLIVFLVTGLIVVFFALYYRGSTMPRGAVPERKSREIEIGWTVATLFTFLFLFWWAASDQLTALTPPKEALEIHVVAKQWMWRIQHPSGAREIDELHVPADTNVRLAMTSQDVIHDLYLPALRLKQDILPDRYTYLWFNANKTGIFHLTCAEFCGTDHSVMAGRLVIVLAGRLCALDRRAAARRRPRPPGRGAVSLARLLRMPHAGLDRARAGSARRFMDSPVQLADGRTVTADEAYLRDCILLPDKTPGGRLSAGHAEFCRQRRARARSSQLVAYLKSLTTHKIDGAGEAIAMTDATLPFVPPLESGGESYLDEGHTLDVVARHHRPQAHRHPLRAVDHRVLLHRRHRHRVWCGSSSSARPGWFLTSDEYNRLFTMHGIIMVWFFLVPSIPATMGNFHAAADDRRAGRRLSAPQSAVLVSLRDRRGVHVYVLLSGGVDTGWTFYPPFSSDYSHSNVIAAAARRLRGRLFVDRHRRQFHRHDPHAACARHDLVPAAAVRLVDVRRQHGDGAGDAGARHVAVC